MASTLKYAAALLLLLPLAGSAARAEEPAAASPPAAQALTGVWLTTDYPAVTESIGDKVSLSISLQNRNLPPKRVEFGVEGLPTGWTWQMSGNGHTVGAAIVQPNADLKFSLELDPPKDAKPGRYDFRVTGKSDAAPLDLPIALTLAEAKPASVTLEPKLPALRGTPRSTFDFDLTAKNESQTDQTFNLLAQAPAGFQAVFKEQYGSQELTSIPIKAGESKSLKLSVTPPNDAAAGQYPVEVGVVSPAASAKTGLVLDVTGQPALALSGPDGRLSGDATAGKERTFNFDLTNSGTAPAKAVTMSASPPNGWKVAFDPEKIEALAPGQKVSVAVSMTPSEKAIAGDYSVNVRASGDGASDSQSFRVTVLTSTMWGVAGLGIIGAAAVVLAFAVTRYGRR
jgi:uncharacterized membrane protein